VQIGPGQVTRARGAGVRNTEAGRTGAVRPLWSEAENLRERISQAQGLFAFFSFDAALSQRASHGHLRTNPAARAALIRLCAAPNTRGAVFSGRRVETLQRRLRLHRLGYVGVNGAEVAVGGGPPPRGRLAEVNTALPEQVGLSNTLKLTVPVGAGAPAGTVTVAVCRSTAACSVRLCASAARVPSTHTALTSPRASVFAGAPSTRAFVPAIVHDTAAAGSGRPAPSRTRNVIAVGSGRPGAPTRTESSGASRRTTRVPAGPTGSPRHPMRHDKLAARVGQRRARIVSTNSDDWLVT